MAAEADATVLTDYVKKNPGFRYIYNSYEPDMAMIDQIKAALPAARVVVVAEYWCGDSRRLVPRMARISEHLTGWSFEALPWDMTTRNKPLQICTIPTFVLYKGDQEIGRIVENPEHGAIENDLLELARKG